MHLIDVRTYKLKYFFTEHLPDYAILSHTWGNEEVTYQEMTAGDLESSGVKSKAGFQKIAYTCKQALADGLDWAWVDTCCIDKTSSAELSEAINSMFAWYRTSSRCYAYMLDYEIAGDGAQVGPSGGEPQTWPDLDEAQFRGSRWFTRGWTLQELVAPSRFDFFSRSWKYFGTKESLAVELESITSIEKAFLLHERPLGEASVAKKMSWAAGRQCTRAEDIAYCLLGIFDINMPLLYGEGHKAFHRLQTEIWREYDDDSLLAWTVPRDDPRAYMPTDVLAASPKDFKNSAGAVPSKQQLGDVSAMTKKGLKLDSPIFLINIPLGSRYTHMHVFRLALNCIVGDLPVSILALLNHQQGSAASYTRIATPEHYQNMRGDFSRMSKITTAYVSRSASEALAAPYRFPADSARVFIQPPPITVTRYGQDPEQQWRLVSPNAARFRRLEMKIIRLEADEHTSLESQHPLTKFVSEGDGTLCAPNVFQLLVTFNEGRRQSGTVKNGFELRCAVQMNSARDVHATYLEWRTWDDGASQPDEAQVAETVGAALQRQQTGLDGQGLVDWARPKLQPVTASIGDLYEAQVDLGDGNMMTAQLKRTDPLDIVGGINHFIVEISFDIKKEMG